MITPAKISSNFNGLDELKRAIRNTIGKVPIDVVELKFTEERDSENKVFI
ncbi:hypothetical protein [Echinicola soli]|nr:hypothetical protein [Echinicola soli]